MLKLEKTLVITINMTTIARRELDKTCTPHTDEPWWPRRHTATMVPHSRRQGIQQSSNMLCDKSTSWNLYYLFNLHDESLMHHVYFNRPRRCHKERPIWRLRRTRYAAILKGCIWTMFFCRGRGWWSCNFSIGGQQKLMLLAMAGSWWEFGWVGSIFGPKRQPKKFVLSFG